MALHTDVGIIDTMIGFPSRDPSQTYAFITKQTKDTDSRTAAMPAGYMFKDIPDQTGDDDPVDVTLREMDRYGIELGLVGTRPGSDGERAVQLHPHRFLPGLSVDPNRGMETLREITRAYETNGLRAVDVFPCGLSPQVAINAPLMYPIYAKCCELGIPVFMNAGVPGPRLRMEPQRVELLDDVMYDFPDLVLVTRHGCEPWTELAVKLLLKWPGLHYSTSAFAPKYYPTDIVDFANSRGADKILYGGYFPMGLSLERIMRELVDVPFKDEVWPKFLRHNAARILKIT